ncbi:MAG: apolipoprotein N-acyltransferase [Thermodesulfovibrionia bacterium]
MLKKTDIALALISGILLVLGFPPFDFYPLAWIALIPLFVSLMEKRAKASFYLGMLTGFVYFTGTVYWIFNSIYFYGNIPAFLSLLILIALCLYLGAYVGVFSVLLNFLSRNSRLPVLFIAPVLWVTLEFLRTYALTGFPWSVLGYSQYKFLTLIQISDITGIYGVSFLVAALNGAIFDVMVYWPKRLSRMPLYGRWQMTIGLIIFSLIVTMSLFYGMWRLETVEKGQKMRVSVIQGNFEQEKKWDIKFKRQIIDTYKEHTLKASLDNSELIVWPETSIPFIFGRDKALTAEIKEFQKTLNSYLLFGGVVVKDKKDDKYQISNSAILMSPDGEVLSVYDKMHLVPYGEYVPLRKIFPFIGKLVVGIGDFIQGKEYTVMDMPGARVSSLICYEIIFPGLVRKFADKGANLFVTITNDAWFGRTSAPYQHFSMAVFRAVENRIPVIRAANTGISGFIDAKGRIQKKSGIFVEAVLTENITLESFKKSFYSRYGDLFAFLCIISSVLLIANNIYPKKRNIP